MLGVPIRAGSSDSQDLNRLDRHADPPRGPLARRGDGAGGAADRRRDPLACPRSCTRFYMYLRQAMGPFAQGPVALIARHGDECVFSVDALGLRPLWQIETADDFVFSSEPGVVAVGDMVSEPKPLAPGREGAWSRSTRERTALACTTTRRCSALVARALAGAHGRRARPAGFDRRPETGGPLEGPRSRATRPPGPSEPVKVEDRVLAGFGWQREDVKLVPADGVQRRRADRLARLRRAARGAVAGAPEPRRLLQGDGRGRHQPGDRPRARDRALLDAARCSAAGPSHRRARTTTRARSRPSFPMILGGHHDLAPLSDAAYRRSRRSTRPTCSRTSGRSSAAAPP